MPTNTLPTKTANLLDKIRESHASTLRLAGEASTATKNAVVSAYVTGKMLIQLKELVGHGKFEKTIADNFDFSTSTALRWMTIAKAPRLEDLIGAQSVSEALGICQKREPKAIGSQSVNLPQVVTKRTLSKITTLTKTLEGIDLIELDAENRATIIEACQPICNWLLATTDTTTETPKADAEGSISVSSETLAITEGGQPQ